MSVLLSLVGAAVSKTNVTQPRNTLQFYIRGTEEGLEDTTSPYNDTTTKYTIIAFDAGYPGANKTDQFYLHYLHNDVSKYSLQITLALQHLNDILSHSLPFKKP